MNPIKDVVIVGGGTAGLIAALYIKYFYSQFNVTVIKSSKIGIVGVGEGSTEHMKGFIDDLDINPYELINETNATIKIGILFNSWNSFNSSYVHSIDDFPLISTQGNVEIYNRLILTNPNPNTYPLSLSFYQTYYKNKVPVFNNLLPSNQFHFDTFGLNNFLVKTCLKRGILVKEHYIEDILLNEKGYITSLLTSNKSVIKGDIFIDCSGFKKVLSSKLNSKTISYTDYLPVNQAITLATDLDLKKGIEPYTKSTALSSGWAWKIPTQERYGNGYVFDNRYIDADNALNEFNHHLGTNVEKEAKNIKFKAYKVEKFWNKNCISIGLAGSFVEPLEAQSIGFSIIQSKLLVEALNSWFYNPLSISTEYNKLTDKVFNNMVDYVQLHYLTKRTDSKFWKDKPFKLTDFNKNTLPTFSVGIFPKINFTSPSIMFRELNFYQIYYGLGLLNLPQISQQVNNSPTEYKQEWNNIYNEYQNHPTFPSISHIDYLKLVRENYSS